VGAGERGDEGVVEGQARPKFHTAMAPHSGAELASVNGCRSVPSRVPCPGADRGPAEVVGRGQGHSGNLLHLKPQGGMDAVCRAAA
jgi:hypothetical protein